MSNPYSSPKSDSASPSPALMLWNLGTVFGAMILGGALGSGIGFALGSFVPGYYRSVFYGGNDPGFDPVAVGIGQGLTQGVVCGGTVGLAIVALYYWYRSRVVAAK